MLRVISSPRSRVLLRSSLSTNKGASSANTAGSGAVTWYYVDKNGVLIDKLEKWSGYNIRDKFSFLRENNVTSILKPEMKENQEATQEPIAEISVNDGVTVDEVLGDAEEEHGDATETMQTEANNPLVDSVGGEVMEPSEQNESEVDLSNEPMEESSVSDKEESIDAVPTNVTPDTTTPSSSAPLPEPSANLGTTYDLSTRVVDEAIHAYTSSANALHLELEESLLRDLDNMDESALRVRVKQLAAEIAQRTKWEGVRLHQALKQVDSTLSQHYSDLLLQQRLEMHTAAVKREAELEQRAVADATQKVFEARATFELELNRALKDYTEKSKAEAEEELRRVTAHIEQDVTDRMNHRVALMREGHVKEQLELQGKMHELGAKLTAYDATLGEVDKLQLSSTAAHRRSAAVLACESAMKTAKPFHHELSAIQAANASMGEPDPLLTAVTASIPPKLAAHGAPTLVVLKSRFAVLRAEMRKAALAPSLAPALVGHAVGSVLASVSAAPRGLVSGSGTEEILARTEYRLEQGELAGALKEMEGVHGYERKLARDWENAARERLLVDQTAAILRSHAIILHSSIP